MFEKIKGQKNNINDILFYYSPKTLISDNQVGRWHLLVSMKRKETKYHERDFTIEEQKLIVTKYLQVHNCGLLNSDKLL